jgi:hypothetical protein
MRSALTLSNIWDKTVRLRTWIVNTAAVILIVLPEILTAPEIVAILPDDVRIWVAALALILNVAMRPWPAVRPGDPEAKATRKK